MKNYSDKIVQTLKNHQEEIIQTIKDYSGKVGHTAKDYSERIGDVAKDYSGKVGHVAKDYSDKASHAVTDYASKVGDVAKDYSDKASHVVTDYAGKVGDAAKDYSGKVGHVAKDYSEVVGHAAKDYSEIVGHAAQGYTGLLRHAAKNYSNKVMRAVKGRPDKTGQYLALAATLAGGVAIGYMIAKRRSVVPPRTVSHIDIERYVGTWFEVARLPTRHERQCTAVKAMYSLREDGTIEVENHCHKGSLQGQEEIVKGMAYVVDPSSNAKLKVQFRWPFSGDYWIIDVGADYEYAVVSTPKRDRLWILSRTPQMDTALYDQIIAKLTDQGFATSRLIKTIQHAQPEQRNATAPS